MFLTAVEAVASSAVKTACDIGAKAIVVLTETGETGAPPLSTPPPPPHPPPLTLVLTEPGATRAMPTTPAPRTCWRLHPAFHTPNPTLQPYP